ncbi:MAG: hypothetical protein OXE85_15805 [Roseovarius sp.]|nr:hypothetical protein [Roseovarius sp.]
MAPDSFDGNVEPLEFKMADADDIWADMTGNHDLWRHREAQLA